MTREQLDELERLEKAATPAPWELGALLHEGSGALTFDHEHNLYPPDTMATHGFQYGGPVAVVAARGEGEDAPFITALRNSAPQLISDARKLRKMEENARLAAVVFKAARDVVSEQQPDGSGHPEEVQELKNALDGFDYFAEPSEESR